VVNHVRRFPSIVFVNQGIPWDEEHPSEVDHRPTGHGKHLFSVMARYPTAP
jgi:hypothetical protein